MNSERFKTLTVNFRLLGGQENSAKSGFFQLFSLFHHEKGVFRGFTTFQQF